VVSTLDVDAAERSLVQQCRPQDSLAPPLIVFGQAISLDYPFQSLSDRSTVNYAAPKLHYQIVKPTASQSRPDGQRLKSLSSTQSSYVHKITRVCCPLVSHLQNRYLGYKAVDGLWCRARVQMQSEMALTFSPGGGLWLSFGEGNYYGVCLDKTYW
jgi:hypothetical protein